MPEQEKIHAQINRDEFQKRTKELFASYYMTIISVIQGVALSVLITNIPDAFKQSANHLLTLFYIIITFTYIVIISYEYATISGVYRWSYRIWDVAIPLLLGVGQSLPSIFLDHSWIWWSCSAGLYFIGILAYINTFLHIHPELFVDGQVGDRAYKESCRALLVGGLIMFVGLVIAIVISIILFMWPKSMLTQYIGLILAVFGVVLMIMKEQQWYRNLHNIYHFIQD